MTHENQGGTEVTVVLPDVVGIVLGRLPFVHRIEVGTGVAILDSWKNALRTSCWFWWTVRCPLIIQRAVYLYHRSPHPSAYSTCRSMFWGKSVKKGVGGQDIRVKTRNEVVSISVGEPKKQMAQGSFSLAHERVKMGRTLVPRLGESHRNRPVPIQAKRSY